MAKRFGIVMSVCAVAAAVVMVMTDQPVQRVVNQPESSHFDPAPTPVQPNDPRLDAVRRANARNQSITSVKADELDIKTKHRFVNISGSLAYEKPNKFRLRVKTRVTDELDAGSNAEMFWFYSREHKGGKLFFCSHAEASKAKMKAAFNPGWLKSALGYDVIDTANIQVFDSKGMVGVVRQVPVGTGDEDMIRITTLLDPQTGRVAGNYLFDKSENAVAGVEVMKYDGAGRPKRWAMTWNAEGLSMELELLNPSFNSPLPSGLWQKPRGKQEVDMSKE